MKIYHTEIDNILFAGDLHGEFPTINSTINKLNLSNCAIIFCGDIGIGFEKEEYYNQTFKKLTKVLKKRNIHLYMFRGNHDDKSYFDGEHFNNFEYIHVIPDYSIIQTPTNNILCVGGAISIDRTLRIRNIDIAALKYKGHHSCDWNTAYENCPKSYWENEPNVYDYTEMANITESGIKIDTVCTHTCPSICQPITKNGVGEWLTVDTALSDDLNAERAICDKLLYYLKEHSHPLTNWYYGHFHFHNTEYIDGVKFTLLDMAKNKLDLV